MLLKGKKNSLNELFCPLTKVFSIIICQIRCNFLLQYLIDWKLDFIVFSD